VTPYSLVRIDVSEKLMASIFRAKRISEAGTTLAVTSNISMLRGDTLLRNVGSYKSYTASHPGK
jgi:hypothetical protein